MIRRHIDLIAIALLLFGVALFSVANRSAAMGCLAVKYHGIRPAVKAPVIVMPEIPRISITRD